MSPEPVVRRILASEWREVRTLRRESVRDPDAAIAFLESPEDVEARDEEFWRARTRRAAEEPDAAQFVAVDGGDWVASLTVLIRRPGAVDHLGAVVESERADVVGVYVRPTHRGDGTIDRLFAAATEWAMKAGATVLTLDVHRDNLRAQGAYRRAGFAPTGVTFTGTIGPELQMARPLS